MNHGAKKKVTSFKNSKHQNTWNKVSVRVSLLEDYFFYLSMLLICNIYLYLLAQCLANRTKNVRALTDWPESKKNHQHLKNLDKSDEMFAIFNNLPSTVGLNLLSLKQVLEPNSSQSNSSIPVKQENISESDTTKTLSTAVEERTQKTSKTPSIQTESKDKNIFYIFRFLIPLIVLILVLIYVFGLAWYYRRQILSIIDSAEKKSQGSMASRISDDDNLRMRYKVMEAKDESLRTMGANKDSTVSQAFPLSRIQ